jgi:hypothetical protein
MLEVFVNCRLICCFFLISFIPFQKVWSYTFLITRWSWRKVLMVLFHPSIFRRLNHGLGDSPFLFKIYAYGIFWFYLCKDHKWRITQWLCISIIYCKIITNFNSSYYLITLIWFSLNHWQNCKFLSLNKTSTIFFLIQVV